MSNQSKHTLDAGPPESEVITAQANRIRDLVSDNVKLRLTLEGLLETYCYRVDWSQPDELIPNVRRAGEVLGHVQDAQTKLGGAQ